MSEASLALRQMLERREREYLMAKTRVKMKTSVENLEVGDYPVGLLGEGESPELPRWVADELVGLNLAESSDEPFEVEMLKALSREKMMGPMQLSPLAENFYLRMRRRVVALSSMVSEGRAKREDVEKVKSGCYDLVGIRLSKLLMLSSSATPSSSLEGKLTPEETAFFSVSQSLSKEWRSALLGGTK